METENKYMFISHHQNAGQNHIMIDKKSFGNAERFKYLVTTVANQNFIREEIKSRLHLGNACYHSVQNLSSHLISKKFKIRIHKTIILLLF
jgi:hypothetical protein